MALTRTVRVLSATALASALLLASAPLAAADQIREDQWALEALNTDAVWKISQGSGVTVAVIDDGVNAAHIDLQGNVLEGKDFMDGGSTTPNPGDDHGTAMASIIAAHGHGVNDGVIGLAPRAKILPVREFGTDGPGLDVSIRYAVDAGASVINVSQCFDSTDQSDLDKTSDAVAYALSRDVLVVGGMGNDGDSSKCYPAASPGALGVGAVKNDGQIWEDSNSGAHVLLSAPGTNIVSAKGVGNGYRAGTGTSDSTAYVSAAVALLRSEFPDLTAGQIVNRLVETAALPESEEGLSLPDEKYGYGIIQPLAALREDIPVGSKYGPLTVPESLQEKSAAPAIGMSDEQQAQSDREAIISWAVIAVVGLAVIGLIVFLIVRLARRSKKKNGDLGGSTGHPQYGWQSGPSQQNPYQQPVSPLQNPYQQSTPHHGQWPPQQ
ncbi:S8 family serine peptidase [Streptomyces poonensis]|uniref:Peptidase S8/S53 domain-containing protein n=1 Tax=Streptomyces poonensis TaxID=68255 RepID=A0A918UVX1_9ACTN|nr:S8 family serine peptidase [Streptomyces poonensis]GGZ39386.1 hypothetical protein GCM10010365_70260 [Streptomyces poonensis]GLJ93082.1 hypothetical protein GCM10017589_56940 [Streptomyces poonensis]